MKFEELKKIVDEIHYERENLDNIKWENLKFNVILFIVESPNKARTIANFFWKPSKRQYWRVNVYEVNYWNDLILITSTIWHIFDLVTKEWFYWVDLYTPIYTTLKKGINFSWKEVQIKDEYDKVEKIIYDKHEIVDNLRKLATLVNQVLIATDPDTEWEKIAYDIYCFLKGYNNNIYRIEYHEVTKKAILNAIKNKREININLVKAQIVRRIADRWVGFTLSKLLKEIFEDENYSAWRVQTPVLWWIIKRYEESKQKKWLIRIWKLVIDEPDLEKINLIKHDDKLSIEILDKEIKEKNPPSPYSTDLLLIEASLKLKLSSYEIMRLAQDLFEAWLITYHRTDSVHISNIGIEIAKTYLNEIWKNDLFYPRSWWEEKTHEWIRPTKPLDVDWIKSLIYSWILVSDLNYNHYRLYDLIFKRFIASQIKPLKYEESKIKIKIWKYEREIIIPTNIVYSTWNDYYYMTIYNIDDLKDFKIEKVSRISPYTEWSIISEMKEKWLWRPSTYANIINSLYKRWYVYYLKTWYLIPTKKWINVYLLLKKYDFVNEEFTSYLENKMDDIEKWGDYIQPLKDLKEKLLYIK